MESLENFDREWSLENWFSRARQGRAWAGRGDNSGCRGTKSKLGR